MNNEDSRAVKNRAECIKRAALQFVDDVTSQEEWWSLSPDNRGRAEELRHQIRVLTYELGLAMEQSAILTKIDMRDIGRVGKRMCAALRFEKYTGSIVERGERLRRYEARIILESGFDAMEQWIDLSYGRSHGVSVAS